MSAPRPAAMTSNERAAELAADVVAFLDGSGTLNGYAFGEDNPDERGRFWWRKHLDLIRNALASLRALTAPAPVGAEWVPREEIRHLSVEDLRAMGNDGIALDAIYRAARIIGEQNGTVGDFDNTLWGALQIAANRYQDLLAAPQPAASGEAICETCNGRGEVGGWRPGEGYGSEPCPDCCPNGRDMSEFDATPIPAQAASGGRMDSYSELSDALGSDAMDSHTGRLDRARRACAALEASKRVTAPVGRVEGDAVAYRFRRHDQGFVAKLSFNWHIVNEGDPGYLSAKEMEAVATSHGWEFQFLYTHPKSGAGSAGEAEGGREVPHWAVPAVDDALRTLDSHGYADTTLAAVRDWLRENSLDYARPTDDKLWDKTLRDRDRYHEIADDLANRIAAYFGWEIGEHSSANCPWSNALDLLAATHPSQPEGKEGES